LQGSEEFFKDIKKSSVAHHMLLDILELGWELVLGVLVLEVLLVGLGVRHQGLASQNNFPIRNQPKTYTKYFINLNILGQQITNLG